MGPGQPGLPGQPQPGWGAPQPNKSSTPVILAVAGLFVAVVGVVGFILISGDDDDGGNAQDDTSQDDSLNTRQPDDGSDPDPNVATTAPPTTTAVATTITGDDPSDPIDGLGPDEVAEMIVTIPACDEGVTFVAPEARDTMLSTCQDGAADDVSSFILSEQDSSAEVELDYSFGGQSAVAFVSLDFRDGFWLATAWCYDTGSCWFP